MRRCGRRDGPGLRGVRGGVFKTKRIGGLGVDGNGSCGLRRGGEALFLGGVEVGEGAAELALGGLLAAEDFVEEVGAFGVGDEDVAEGGVAGLDGGEA